MIDWDHNDSVADLREKISTLRAMLRDAHRREDALVRNSRLQRDLHVEDKAKYQGGIAGVLTL